MRWRTAIGVRGRSSHAKFMSTELQRFQEHLRGTRAPRTVGSYWRIVQAFSKFVGHAESQPLPCDVERFLARPLDCGRARCATTRNQELAALKSLGNFARRRGYWILDPTQDIVFAKEARRDPAFLCAEELRQLFEAAGNEADTGIRARDLAIVAVLSQAGLRVHELVGLNVDQVNLATRTLLAVSGKGDTRSDIPLNHETAMLLRAWFEARQTMADEMESALFVSKRATRMSIRCVERLIERLRIRMGTKKRFSPHSLRHSTGTLALLFGVDLATVGELLRHASLDVTRRYLHLIDQRRRSAVTQLAKVIPLSVLPSAPPGYRLTDRPMGAVSDDPGASETPAKMTIDDQVELDDAA